MFSSTRTRIFKFTFMNELLTVFKYDIKIKCLQCKMNRFIITSF
jgi:hypothetical protein